MPVISVYHGGVSAGCPSTAQNHDRAKRSVVIGWSASSSRSLNTWLKSVDTSKLTGQGFSFTLTFKNSNYPATAQEFHSLRTSYIKRLRRMGAIRIQWLVEWTKAKVPHIHGMVYFPDSDQDYIYQIQKHWLDVTAHLGTKFAGQNSKLIHDADGWRKYLAKHAQRGMYHVQRHPDSIPPDWGKTGRMWGKTGDWPDDFKLRIETANPGYHAYRRIVRSWRVAQARKIKTRNLRSAKYRKQAIMSAKTMLRCHDRLLSTVRGVSEWIPLAVSDKVIDLLAQNGYQIEST